MTRLKNNLCSMALRLSLLFCVQAVSLSTMADSGAWYFKESKYFTWTNSGDCEIEFSIPVFIWDSSGNDGVRKGNIYVTPNGETETSILYYDYDTSRDQDKPATFQAQSEGDFKIVNTTSGIVSFNRNSGSVSYVLKRDADDDDHHTAKIRWKVPYHWRGKLLKMRVQFTYYDGYISNEVKHNLEDYDCPKPIASGITLKFKTENDTVTIFTLYDEWKDRTVFINDRNRRLHSGDIFTQGVYWTHKFDPTFNVDVYYMFNDVDDKQPESAERAHFADASTSLHTAGLRFFGKYSIIDYSLEGAHQFGRGAYGEHLDADMIDARLNIHLYDDSDFKPILGFNYTHFSGDDPGTGRLEGWNPLMTQCPLWGEELMPIMLNGMWSNLESLRTFVSFNVINDLKFTLSATDYLADEKNSAVAGMAPTGGGDHVGLLLSAIASYKIMDNMSILGYVSHFMAGDYFANGHDSYWFRLELNVAF